MSNLLKGTEWWWVALAIIVAVGICGAVIVIKIILDKFGQS